MAAIAAKEMKLREKKMPNNINNHLSVEGDANEIAEFFKKAASGAKELDFETFVSVPDDLEDDWDLIALWGTDRNCYEVEVDLQNCIVFFQTAYNFPSPVLEEMSAQFPNLVFTDRWVDEYGEILGIVRCQNGECELLSEDTEEAKAWRETCHQKEKEWLENWELFKTTRS